MKDGKCWSRLKTTYEEGHIKKLARGPSGILLSYTAIHSIFQLAISAGKR